MEPKDFRHGRPVADGRELPEILVTERLELSAPQMQREIFAEEFALALRELREGRTRGLAIVGHGGAIPGGPKTIPAFDLKGGLGDDPAFVSFETVLFAQ